MAERIATLRGFDTESLDSAIPWEWFEHGLLESPSAVEFRSVREGVPDAGTFHSGLVFGKDAELRWKRLRSGVFRVVCVDDRGRGLTGSTRKAEVELLGEDQIVLWGEPQGQRAEWFEPRVPRRIIEYPAQLAGKRVCVRVRRYRMRGSGGESSRYLFRCAGLVGIEDKGGR